ncbi:MAG: hypothetical protein GX121_03320 [Ignavibacteria bacterium]|nr:hypothetical protein [Ignavibacteria bacterium]
MNNQKSIWDNNLFAVLVPFLIFALARSLMALNMKVPVVWPDEYIYLFYAQFFSGLKELIYLPASDLVGSFGYPLLIAPLYIFFREPTNFYNSVIIFNAILGSTLYIGIFYLVKNILGANNRQAMLIGVLTSLYPAFVLQSNMAYTDSITPALFVFSLLTFFYWVKNKTFFSNMLFILTTGYLTIVHIRFLPLVFTTVFVIAYLVYLKKIPLYQFVILLISFSIITFLNISIGDNLNLMITERLERNDRIMSSLIQVIEALLMIMVLFFTIYFLAKKDYISLASIYLGFFAGLLFGSWDFAFIIPAIFLAFLVVLKLTKNISSKRMLYSSLFCLATFFLVYLSFPNIQFAGIVFSRILHWMINSFGTLYYATFATFGLFLIGFAILFYRLINDGLETTETPISQDGYISKKTTTFYFKKLLSTPENITLFYYLVSAFLLFFITKTTTEYSLSHYRADHFFYGRYIEAFIAPIIAFGAFSLFESNFKRYFLSISISALVFLIITASLVFNYGNIIDIEVDFRSCLSFFTLRAPLGNINLILYAIIATVVSFIFIYLLRKKLSFGVYFLSLGFIAMILFTYHYVIVYHQEEKQYRNQLIDLVNEINPKDTIFYDRAVRNSFSGNSMQYIFLLPERNFRFSNTSNLKAANVNYLISTPRYASYNRNAILLGIEQSGEDYLWLNPSPIQDSIRKTKMPSYRNLDLTANYIGGITKKGFYKENWINGKAELICSCKGIDTNYRISLIIGSSDRKAHNLILWLNDQEYFNQEIKEGVWEYTIDLKVKEEQDLLYFKFFSDLTKDSENRLNGIKLISFKLLDTSYEKQEIKLDDDVFDNTSSINPDIKIFARRNIDWSLLNLTGNDTVQIPIVIKNQGKNTFYPNGKHKIMLSYYWQGFLLKDIKMQSSEQYQIPSSIAPGEELEIFVTLQAPSKAAKYFLKLDLFNKTAGFLDKENKFSNPILFKIL